MPWFMLFFLRPKKNLNPRIKAMKYHLKSIEEQKQKILDKKNLKNELTLIMTRLEQSASGVQSNLEHADWSTKHDLIRTLVKRIKINHQEVCGILRKRAT
jgi:site-specific DNA recombinase